MKPLGDGFIKLIKMMITPIVFTTIVVGIAKTGDMKQVGRVSLKALVNFEVVSTMALVEFAEPLARVQRWPLSANKPHEFCLRPSWKTPQTLAERGFTVPSHGGRLNREPLNRQPR